MLIYLYTIAELKKLNIKLDDVKIELREKLGGKVFEDRGYEFNGKITSNKFMEGTYKIL